MKRIVTDEELDSVVKMLLKRAKSGNLTAIKMIFEYTDEETYEEKPNYEMGMFIVSNIENSGVVIEEYCRDNGINTGIVISGDGLNSEEVMKWCE